MTDSSVRVRTPRRADPTTVFGLALFIVLLVANLATNPSTFDLESLPTTLGFAAPIAMVAIAATVPMLMGNGGIDISVGPVAGVLNVFTVVVLVTRAGITSPFIVVPTVILGGMAIGLVTGLIVAFARIQPIVVTLGMYLIAAGASLVISPTPGGSVPPWLGALAGDFSFVLFAVAVVAWWLFRQLPVYGYLMAYGGDERAVYTTGISVKLVRVMAFVVGGFFSGLAALALSAMLGSADPTVGVDYTLLGIAAATLGGVSLMGGTGGITRALLGAFSIFLLQNLLTFLGVSAFALQVAYGSVLVVAVGINGWLGGARGRRRKETT